MTSPGVNWQAKPKSTTFLRLVWFRPLFAETTWIFRNGKLYSIVYNKKTKHIWYNTVYKNNRKRVLRCNTWKVYIPPTSSKGKKHKAIPKLSTRCTTFSWHGAWLSSKVLLCFRSLAWNMDNETLDVKCNYKVDQSIISRIVTPFMGVITRVIHWLSPIYRDYNSIYN